MKLLRHTVESARMTTMILTPKGAVSPFCLTATLNPTRGPPLAPPLNPHLPRKRQCLQPPLPPLVRAPSWLARLKTALLLDNTFFHKP